MAAYGVIGCGYVGSDVAVRMKYVGHHVVGTTRSSARLGELSGVVHEAHQLDLTAPDANLDFLEQLDGLLISVAPTQQGEGYSLSLIHISEPTRRRGTSYAVFCLK